MTDNTQIENEFINYDELYSYLNKKINATHDELRYWIKLTMLCYECPLAFKHDIHLRAYLTDLPFHYSENLYDYDMNLEPSTFYFKKQAIEDFMPPNYLRFVYLKDLPMRWANYSHQLKDEVLTKASKKSILRMYDKEKDEFTLEYVYRCSSVEYKNPWCDTSNWEERIYDVDTFFLLEDILKIERLFFDKEWHKCLEELQYKKNPPPIKVLPFNKPKTQEFKVDGVTQLLGSSLEGYLISDPDSILTILGVEDAQMPELLKLLGGAIISQFMGHPQGPKGNCSLTVKCSELKPETIATIARKFQYIIV